MSLLECRNLDVRYDDGAIHAVEDVSLEVERGERLGLLGESGCGKTTLGDAITGLLGGDGKITGGEILFDGETLTDLSESELRAIRWAEIATIPQESMSGLNPSYRVGEQIEEALLHHEAISPTAARERTAALLRRVDLDPEVADAYPHTLSGGMSQRAMIAMALACKPALVIADEPTAALDVLVQQKILSELSLLSSEFGTAVLLISHDVGVVAELCDRVAVMYGGTLMEVGDTERVLETPANPYTMGLRNAVPSVADPDADLVSIPGTAPTLRAPASGCRFRERCPFATEDCATAHPPLEALPSEPHSDEATADGTEEVAETTALHRSACHYPVPRAEMRTAARAEETWSDSA